MTKNEFIAGVSAARFLTADISDSITKAVALASELELMRLAPWVDKQEPAADLSVVPVAGVQIGPGPASVKKILSDLSNQIPSTSGVPQGVWELVFRPAKEVSGIIRPVADVAKRLD